MIEFIVADLDKIEEIAAGCGENFFLAFNPEKIVLEVSLFKNGTV